MSGFERLRPLSYPECDVFVICFSLVCHFSLKSVAENWVSEIRRHRPKAPIILVGTKLDLKLKDCENVQGKSEKFLVEDSQALTVKEKIKAADYIICSAQESTGVLEVFESAIQAALKRRKKKSKKFCARRVCKLQ